MSYYINFFKKRLYYRFSPNPIVRYNNKNYKRMGPFLGKEAKLLPMGGLSDSVTISGASGGGFTAT